MTAEEARIYRDLQSDVASMRSDAEYVKDHLKQLETESRKWAALEQNVEGRAVAGWANKIRNLGGVVFVGLRDRYGLVQVAIEENGQAAIGSDRCG